MQLTQNGTLLTWWAGVSASLGGGNAPSESEVSLLGYISQYLTCYGVRNTFDIFTPSDKSIFVIPVPVLLDRMNVTSRADGEIHENVLMDVFPGIWTYSAARLEMVHFPPSPAFFTGINAVLSLAHVRPLSMWLLAEIYDLSTWLAILAHLVLVLLLLSVLNHRHGGRSTHSDYSAALVSIVGLLTGQELVICPFRSKNRFGIASDGLQSSLSSYSSSSAVRRFVRQFALIYLIWFCFAVQIFFNQRLHTALFSREEDNLEDWEAAIADPDILLSFSHLSFLYKVVLADWVPLNVHRIVTYEGFIVPIDHFFDPAGRRVAAIKGEFLAHIVLDVNPELNLHIGSNSGMQVPIGWMLNRRTFGQDLGPGLLQGKELLGLFQRGLSTTNEIGINQYWQMRDKLAWRSIAAAHKQSLNLDELSSDHFEDLTVDHLRLAFFALAILLAMISILQYTLLAVQKAMIKNKLDSPPDQDHIQKDLFYSRKSVMIHRNDPTIKPSFEPSYRSIFRFNYTETDHVR